MRTEKGNGLALKLSRRSFLLSAVAPSVLAACGVDMPSPIAQQSEATAQVLAPAAGSPDGVAALPTNNSMTVRNASGSGKPNWPFARGRIFRRGEIRGAPQGVWNGSPLPTQANVYTRWDDGSVQFARIACVLPMLPNNTAGTLTFRDQDETAQAALTKDELLSSGFDFGCTVAITRTGGGTEEVSARTMLSNDDYQVKCQGQVSQCVLVGKRGFTTYDLHGTLQVYFWCEFWPGINKTRVRVELANSNSQRMTDITYDVSIAIGNSNPMTVYMKSNYQHRVGTFWSKVFWINGAPVEEVNVDHNRTYLRTTRFFPPFLPREDTRLDIPQGITASRWASHQRINNDIDGISRLEAAMSGGGAHEHVGPIFAVDSWLLFSGGDWRYWHMMEDCCDGMGRFPLWVWEGDAARKFDRDQKISAQGRYISVYARPTMWMADHRDNRIQDTRANESNWPGWDANKFNVTVSLPYVLREFDTEHFPNVLDYMPIFSGDPFWIDRLIALGMSDVFGYQTDSRQGLDPLPFSAHQTLVTRSVRDMGWGLRSRSQAFAVAPDGSPEKDYLRYGLEHDCLSFFEGHSGISSPRSSNSYYASGYRAGTNHRGYPLRPIRVEQSPPGENQSSYNNNLLPMRSPIKIWMHVYALYGMKRCRDLGLTEYRNLLEYHYEFLRLLFADDVNFPWQNGARYENFVATTADNPCTTWAQTLVIFKNPPPTDLADSNPSADTMGYLMGITACFADDHYTEMLSAHTKLANVIMSDSSHYNLWKGGWQQWAMTPRTAV